MPERDGGCEPERLWPPWRAGRPAYGACPEPVSAAFTFPSVLAALTGFFPAFIVARIVVRSLPIDQGAKMDRARDDEDLAADNPATPPRSEKRPDMSWRDHLTMLLSFGAAAEHCLMVQYLYAAYSMRTEGQSPERAEKIEGWRSNILAVAREEMGHLLTVQNVLLLLGAPTALGRDNSEWASQYYPYPFSLEPMSLETLACFVYAEMPDIKAGSSMDPEVARLIADVRRRMAAKFPAGMLDINVHRVGALYQQIIDLIADEKLIPDSAFDESSYEFQASWDEWGRGYKPAPYELKADGSRASGDGKIEAVEIKDGADSTFLVRLKWDPTEPASETFVRIDRMATRADAIKALHALAKQGEAPHLSQKAHAKSSDELSHFDRFLKVYQMFLAETEKSEGWSPAAGVSSNPTTRQLQADEEFAQVTAVVAKRLAQLFNQRYRLLLNYLAHSFRLARAQRIDRPNLRAMLMHRVFGEMYNLKTLAGLLVRAPRVAEGEADGSETYDGARELAGPPFEMPYSLTLPDGDVDAWRLHQDLINTSLATARRLLKAASEPKGDEAEGEAPEKEDWRKVRADLKATGAEPFVRALMNLDEQATTWIGAIIAAAGSKGTARR